MLRPYTPEQIARVVHGANTALQAVQGDCLPAAPWDAAPAWMRESLIAGVVLAMHGKGPAELHEAWVERMRAAGWVWGPEKSPLSRTHPCMLHYDQLPSEQRDKDVMLHVITTALTT